MDSGTRKAFREFHLPEDATRTLRGSWLRPGERVRWSMAAGVDHYMVEGRLPDGRRRSAWSVASRMLLQALLLPLMLCWWCFYTVAWLGAGTSPSRNGYTGDGLFWPYRTPRVIVTGSKADCAAALSAERLDLGGDAELWVLTDQRFARVLFRPTLESGRRDREVEFHHGIEFLLNQHHGLTAEPMECVTELEFMSSQFRYEPGCVRRLPRRFRQPRVLVYRRLILADGSGFDFIDTEAHPEYR